MRQIETVISHMRLPVATRLREATEFRAFHATRGCDHGSQDMARARNRAMYGDPAPHYHADRCERHFGRATVVVPDDDTAPGGAFLRWQRGEQ